MTFRRETVARASKLASLAVVALSTLSCDSPTTVRGSEIATYVAAVSIDDLRGGLQPTAPPAAGAGPSVSVPSSQQGITGGSFQFDLTGSAGFRTVAVVVEGVEGHYLVQLPSEVSAARAIITIGGRVPVASFVVRFALANADGDWGPQSSMTVNALSVAGGDIQVSATWDTDADVDLHVIDPSGEEIYYGSTMSSSGGVLDIDANAACSTSSLFQENIGWERDTAPEGQYIVRLDYWSDCGATRTDYIVTVYLRSDAPAVPGSPGSGVLLFTGTFVGAGDSGGAGSGRDITTFVF